MQGSGRGGKVLKGDVLALVEGNGGAPPAPAAAPAPAEMPPPGAKPIRGPAATLARFMNESRTIPTATSFRTLSVSWLDARRRALKGAGQKLSFTHLIAWAIVQAAREMHVMTNAYAEADGKPQRIVPEGVSLGLAVDVERKDGTRSLIVPVIHQADQLDFPSFAARYDELVVGARDNTLPPDAYTGANITLTNPGGIGTVASVPRLMPGQGTIIATGAIALPPGLAQADPVKVKELGVGKVMTMTSTYDHRVIQGAESGEFLRRIDNLLQGENDFYDNIFGVARPDGACRRRAGRRRRHHHRRGPGACRGQAGRRRAPPARSSSRRSRRPPPSSRRTGCTAISPRGSTRSARRRAATRRSTRRR